MAVSTEIAAFIFYCTSVGAIISFQSAFLRVANALERCAAALEREQPWK